MTRAPKVLRVMVFVALAGLFGTALPAHAATRINVQTFRPAGHEGDLFITLGSHIPEHLRWTTSMMLNFGKNPLVFVEDVAGGRHEVIQNQLTLDLMGSIALYDWVDVSVAVPVFLLNSGQEAGFMSDLTGFPSFVLGDVRLSPKVRIISRKWETNKGYADGIGLALDLSLGLPTGNADAFVSDGFSFVPSAVVDYKIGPALIAVNLGARVRSKAEIPSFLEVGTEFVWRAGASYEVLPDQLQVIGELYGSTSDFGARNPTNLEGILGGRYTLKDVGLAFSLGGGSGMTKGYGSTKFRIFAGVAYAEPIMRDADGDGLFDDVDQCPLEAEDKDQFEDEDGCPESDNDKDGIVDTKDKCPNDAEDKDEYQDDDGCPDADNDGDGLEDKVDKCPNDAEDKDEFEDEDGCPDEDNDKDGLKDADDQCPNKPETKNGFQDEDGCPDETLAKIDKGQIVITQKIFFDYRKTTIKEESTAVMRSVGGILLANPNIKVRIEGHTDDRGSTRANQKLSQERAASVRQWLIEAGVGIERMESVGVGEDRPLIAEKTKEAREKNRRVEFHILD